MQLSSWLPPLHSVNTLGTFTEAVVLIEPIELSPLSSPLRNWEKKNSFCYSSLICTQKTPFTDEKRSFWEGDNVFLSFSLASGHWRQVGIEFLHLLHQTDEQEFQFLIAVSAKIIDSVGENNLYPVKGFSVGVSCTVPLCITSVKCYLS